MAIRMRFAQAMAAAIGVAAIGALAVGPALAATPAANLFYQRAVMTAADGACRLFSPDVGAALAASKAQARGAALRSGADAAGLAAVEAQAASAGAAGCRSPEIAAAAEQVRAAFAGYARLDHMDFPGEFASWLAERPAQDTDTHWRAYQRDRFGWDVLEFGLAGHGADRPLTAVATFADGAQPYGARLVMRDAAATTEPYLDVRQADIDGHLPIDARLPPRSATRVFEAGEMKPADKGLITPANAGAWSFAFPQAASDAMADLDPRESVAVEFLFAGDDGEAVRTAYVEVGDFAAARAFQAIPRR
jgi:hypothetical protein